MKVEIDVSDVDGSIRVDGHDIADHLRWFALDGKAGQRPTLTLDLAVRQTATATCDADVQVSEPVHTLLQQLGWAPPGQAHALPELDEVRLDRGRLQAQRDTLAAVLDDVLRRFVHKGHPGNPCMQTGWIPLKTIVAWQKQLAAATTPPN